MKLWHYSTSYGTFSRRLGETLYVRRKSFKKVVVAKGYSIEERGFENQDLQERAEILQKIVARK